MAETNENIEKQVFYVFDKKIKDALDNIKNIKCRSAVVHTLIKRYKLLDKCVICPIEPATEEEILSFHSQSYVEYLKNAQNSKDLEKVTYNEETANFNLEYDCPLFENIYDFASIIAGGSLTAARLLVKHQQQEVTKENRAISCNTQPKSYLKFKQKEKLSDRSNVYDMPGDVTLEESMLEEITEKQDRVPRNEDHIERDAMEVEPIIESCEGKVAINWFGGWHHAQRDSAEGFCYVNDIVIAIHELLKTHKRVLYVDLDVHHGNGVENAFSHTSRVMTVSFHKHEVGYYPGSGGIEDVGIGPGRHFAVNVPLKDGITDEPYINLFRNIMEKVHQVYKPECVVVQCGADSLSGDPLGGFNLSLVALGNCVNYILSWKLPTLLLGGGGYNIANTARCYAYLTAVALGERIPSSIPENDFFHLFGPGFELDVTQSLRKDENSAHELKQILKTVLQNLDNVKI